MADAEAVANSSSSRDSHAHHAHPHSSDESSEAELTDQQQVPLTHDDSASDSDDDGSDPAQWRMAEASSAPFQPPQPPLDLSAIGVYRHTLWHIQRNPSFQHSSGPARMALLGVALGVALGVGSQWALLGGQTALRQFGLYLAAMSAFHLLEFVWTAIFHPSKLSAQSFLLNHSREYHAALAAGIAEFLLEAWLWPGLKYPRAGWVMWMGLVLVVAGQSVRTLAMLTAADNFTHIVADSKAPNHQLVTHGIYSLCRHPSYAGWFWWSVGTQVLLCNPLCTVAYAAASFLFFRGRIRYEEHRMLAFFGDSYVQYQKRVPTGVPFVKGFVSA